MGYVNKQLASGERVTYEAKLHWQIFILPTLVLLLGGFLYWNKWFILSYSFLGLGFIFLVVFGLIPYFANKFFVTNKHASQKNIFPSYFSNDIPLNQITGIIVKMPILGRIFNYGNVVFQSASGEQVFKGVSSPREFRQAIEKAQNPQQESQVIQTNSPQSEKEEFWRRLPEFIQEVLARFGFISIDDPTDRLFYYAKFGEMLNHPTHSGRIQYLQLLEAEAEKEQDLDKKKFLLGSIHRLYEGLKNSGNLKGCSDKEYNEFLEMSYDSWKNYDEFSKKLELDAS